MNKNFLFKTCGLIVMSSALLVGCGPAEQDYSNLEKRRKPLLAASVAPVEEELDIKGLSIPESQKSNFSKKINPSNTSTHWNNGIVSPHLTEGPDEPAVLAQLLRKILKTDGGEKQEAVFALWVFAADHGVPEEAVMALDFATYDSDPEVAKIAKQAIDDLFALESRSNFPNEIETIQTETKVDEEANDLDTVIETWGTQATLNLSPEKRSEAIRVLSLYQGNAVVDVMVEAAQDNNVENRFRALQSLWIAAADGLDHDGYITETLLSALTDKEAEISELAERALADLDNLKKRISGELSFFQADTSDHPLFISE